MGRTDAVAIELGRDILQAKAGGIFAADDYIGEEFADLGDEIDGRTVANGEEGPGNLGVGIGRVRSILTGTTDIDGFGKGVFRQSEGGGGISEGGDGQGSAEQECETQGQENTGCFHDYNLQFLRYM